MGTGHILDDFNGGGFEEIESFFLEKDELAIEKFKRDYFSHAKYSSWYLALYRENQDGKIVFIINND